MTHTLKVYFYNPSSDTEGWINKVVSWMDPPFCHVEVLFERDNLACAIYMDTVVSMRTRAFDMEKYTCISCACSKQKYANALAYARQCADDKVPFSRSQMANCLLKSTTNSKTNSNTVTPGTFCSKLSTQILQCGGILNESQDPDAVSPSHLFRLLQQYQEANRASMTSKTPKAPVIQFKT